MHEALRDPDRNRVLQDDQLGSEFYEPEFFPMDKGLDAAQTQKIRDSVVAARQSATTKLRAARRRDSLTKSAQFRGMGSEAVAALSGSEMLELLRAEASTDFSNAVLRSEWSKQNKVSCSLPAGGYSHIRGCVRFVIQSERGKLLQPQSAKFSNGSMTLVRPNPYPNG